MRHRSNRTPIEMISVNRSSRTVWAPSANLGALLFGLVFAAGCGSDTSEDVPGTTSEETSQDPAVQIQQSLAHQDWNRRLDAAWQLGDRQDIPAPARLTLLLDALEREINQPTLGPAPRGTYLSTTEWLRYVYTRALGKLAPQALETLRQAVNQQTGEVRARAVLALGYAGQRDAIPELQALLRTSTVGDVRSDAAYLLGELEAHEAIPDLRQAALDTYLVDVDNLDGGATELYPVRVSAMKALEELGLTVELTEEGEYRVLDP